MADALTMGFEITKNTFTGVVGEIRHKQSATNKYTLRETGRQLGKIAKAAAPKYKITTPADGKPYVDPRAAAESGALKRSIRNGKEIISMGQGDDSMRFGPFAKSKGKDVITRFGTAGGHLSQMEGIAIAKASAKGKVEGFHRAKAATKKKPAKEGSSTAGQVRGAPLYAPARELKYGYMAKATSTGSEVMAKILEDAQAKSLLKYK